MLSWLRRPKAELDIEVSEEAASRHRDTIDVHVTLSAHEQFHVREGRIELRCTRISRGAVVGVGWRGSVSGRAWYSPEFGAPARGSPWESGSGHEISPQFSHHQSQIFLSETAAEAGTVFHDIVSFSLPHDAVPSIKGSLVWRIDVTLDIAGRRNLHKAKEVTAQPRSG